MSARYGNKVGPLVSRKTSYFKKNRYDRNLIKRPKSSGGSSWVRPADWLTMPTITSSEQKIALLMPIFPQGSNLLAFTVAGAYTVDWGDGTASENVATGIKAQHLYDYADPDLNATVTSEGYKMAVVVITPQGGSDIISVNFNQIYALAGSGTVSNSSPILEIILSCPNLTSITLGNTTATSVFCKELINFSGVNMGGVTLLSGLFANLAKLSNVSFDTIGNILSTSSMFQGCSSLTSVPLFNTASVTTMASMFSGCSSLISVPLFNTAAVATSMISMFSGCSSLTSVPLFNTASVNSMASMFLSCVSLTSVPFFNTASVTSMASMFQSCSSLVTVPLFNTAAVTTMASMFASCSSLVSVPLFNTALVNTMLTMFSGCSSLTSVPLFNTASVTSMSGMFLNCVSLVTVPAFNTVLVTNFGVTISSIFFGCVSLTRASISNISASISYSGCKLNKEELESIFDSLNTAASTITISSNWGAPTTVSLTGTSTARSTTVTMVSTTGIEVGMQVTNTGSPLSTFPAVTFTDAGDIVTLSNHGLSADDEVSFATITTTSGIVINTIYYVIYVSSSTFQLAATPSGSTVTLTTDGTGTLRHRTEVASIITNTSVTMTRPMASSATSSLIFRQLKTGTALLKGWTVAG